MVEGLRPDDWRPAPTAVGLGHGEQGGAAGEREEGGEGAVGEEARYMKARVVRPAVGRLLAVVLAAVALVLGWVIGRGLVGQ